jgi:hypothetical protein
MQFRALLCVTKHWKNSYGILGLAHPPDPLRGRGTVRPDMDSARRLTLMLFEQAAIEGNAEPDPDITKLLTGESSRVRRRRGGRRVSSFPARAPAMRRALRSSAFTR